MKNREGSKLQRFQYLPPHLLLASEVSEAGSDKEQWKAKEQLMVYITVLYNTLSSGNPAVHILAACMQTLDEFR